MTNRRVRSISKDNESLQKPDRTAKLRLDKRIWTGPPLSSLIVYGVDAGLLVLATEPSVEYEQKALFRERARVSTENRQYLVKLPQRVYDFYHLDEANFTVIASEIRPRTIEILL